MELFWDEPLDPSDFKDYVAEWGNLLSDMSDSIVSVIVTVPSEAALVGLEVDTVERPVTHNANDVAIWFKVAPASQGDLAFEGNGVRFAIPVRITTAGGRIIEKSWNLTVAQQ